MKRWYKSFLIKKKKKKKKKPYTGCANFCLYQNDKTVILVKILINIIYFDINSMYFLPPLNFSGSGAPIRPLFSQPCNWRADFQNLLHPLLHVIHLQLRSQQKNPFSAQIYFKWKMLILIEI